MPKLWADTIETHRRAVADAAIDATAELVAEQGLLSVTMSQIAKMAGIGRATLYKYFPDVEAVLQAWHERQVSRHVEQLERVRDQADEPAERLEAVLQAYALTAHQTARDHDNEIAVLLHRGEHVVRAHQYLHAMIRDLVAADIESGDLRDDMAPDELTTYCLHALSAAGGLSSTAAVGRLVEITLVGLRPQR